MAVQNIPNEVSLKQVLYGTEITPGTAVTPTGRLSGQFSATKNRALRRTPEATGKYDQLITPKRQQATYSGSYAGDMTFEEFPAVMQYGVKGGVAGVSDAQIIPGYSYTFSPSGAVDDVDSATVQFGVDGMGFEASGVRWDEFTLAADTTNADDVLKFSATPFIRNVDRLPGGFQGVATGGSTSTAVMTGAGWTIDEWVGAYFYHDYGTHIGEVRQVLSNTATTLTFSPPVLAGAVVATDVFYLSGLFPVIVNTNEEAISLEGSKLFLDVYNPSASTVGTTDVSERVLSLSVTQALGLTPKRRLPGIIGRVGRGMRLYTGLIRFEADRWDEYKDWEEDTFLSIRWEKEGSVIDAAAGTTKLARIDLEKTVVDVITEDADNNNITHSVAFVTYLPETASIATFLGINKLATLP